MNKIETITLYTASSLRIGQRGPGSFSWIIEVRYEDGKVEKKHGYGSDAKATQHKLLLLAIIEGLEALKPGIEIKIYISSRQIKRFCIECLKRWDADGYIRANGSEVKNWELWQRLSGLLESVDASWTDDHPDKVIESELKTYLILGGRHG